MTEKIRPYAVCRTPDWLKEIERRGLLAEYIVAHALDLADAVRSEWDAYDLLLPNGIKIEVKSRNYRSVRCCSMAILCIANIGSRRKSGRSEANKFTSLKEVGSFAGTIWRSIFLYWTISS